MNWFTSIFHTHDFVYTKRKVIGRGTKDCTVGTVIDIQPTTIYLYYGYCMGCGERGLIGKKSILDILDTKQPYDKDE